MKCNIILILSAICLLASCSVEEGGKDLFNIPLDGYTLFEADFESVDLAGDESDFIWNKETAIGVFGSKSGENKKYTLKNAFDGKSAGEFYGPLVSGDMFMAYYPYSVGLNLYDGALPYSVSPVQSYRQDVSIMDHFLDYSDYVYAFANNDNKLRFGYVSGILAIQVAFTENLTITSIELISDDVNIAGMGRVNPDMSVTMGESGSKHIKVDFGDGIISNVGGKASTYPVVLSAGSYENIKLVLTTVEIGEIVCDLGQLIVERVSAKDYEITEIVVNVGALGGFEVEGDLEFETKL